MQHLFVFALVLCGGVLIAVDAHGRFMKPPNRSSIWRVPEFAGQNPPPNYSDNELYCGGLHQANDPGSNCGVCGDPSSSPSPRANEIGGTFYKGIITGDYSAGQIIDIEVELTVSHLGAMEFRLCTNPQTENQACFNQNVLRIAGGGPGSGTTKLPAGPTGLMRSKLQLPSGVRCNHCIIQWNYRAGNNWGDCGNGTSATGCGPQETFRGCSDIRIR
ncbi:uncharacterized protein LOC110859526 [Folsomia candida]|uniref:uncharacterized protein LOC110859526 n=1 Tax=Folsomia candida TaxID=158441 RepID=UPI000B8F2A41|nr:uncharacterized protein LOC110859526 [Folsomia candida]